MHSLKPAKLTILASIFLAVSCSDGKALKPKNFGPYRSASRFVVESSDVEASSGTGADENGEVSLTSGFAATLHPLLLERCGTCHASETAPFFASTDAAASLDETMKNKKVDLVNVERSRFLGRLDPDKHYCWNNGDCIVSRAEMKAKIEEWRGSVNDGSIEKLADDASALESPALKLSNAIVSPNPDRALHPDRTLLEAESGTLSAGFAAAPEAKASGGKSVNMAANGNSVSITANIATAGTYYFYGLTSSAALNNTSVDVSIDGGPAIRWLAPVTGADLWKWTAIQGTAGPVTATLAAGAHTVSFTRVQNGFKIDLVGITTESDFIGGEIEPTDANLLIFDLSKAKQSKVAKGVVLKIQASELDEKSYKFKSPQLIVPTGSVKIKGLKILLNGVWDPQNATYMALDEVVAAPGKTLTLSPMIVPKDKGSSEDLISVQFETLE